MDATIVAAPSSTKNADKARDPDMHQTHEGQQWHFGLKMRIGVDGRSSLVHSAAVTTANAHDKILLEGRPYGEERRVCGDSAYASQRALTHEHALQAKDFTCQRIHRRGRVDEAERSRSRNKSRMRARVEHVFAVVERPWEFTKLRNRGPDKNANLSFVALALANQDRARTPGTRVRTYGGRNAPRGIETVRNQMEETVICASDQRQELINRGPFDCDGMLSVALAAELYYRPFLQEGCCLPSKLCKTVELRAETCRARSCPCESPSAGPERRMRSTTHPDMSVGAKARGTIHASHWDGDGKPMSVGQETGVAGISASFDAGSTFSPLQVTCHSRLVFIGTRM